MTNTIPSCDACGGGGCHQCMGSGEERVRRAWAQFLETHVHSIDAEGTSTLGFWFGHCRGCGAFGGSSNGQRPTPDLISWNLPTAYIPDPTWAPTPTPRDLPMTEPTTAVSMPLIVCRLDCDHPRPIEFRDGDVFGQFCPLCGLQRRPGEDWDAPSDPLMDDKVDEMESLLERVLELALDLDAWSGGDEIHNGSDGRRMLMAIRSKLGLPNFFGDWILSQHERTDRIGVVARFLKEHADVDSLRRGGGMFPDVSHVRAFILAHRRSSWVDIIADAEAEYRTRYSLKLDGLVAAYWRDADAPDEISNPDETP